MTHMLCGVFMRAGGVAPGLGGMLAALPGRDTDVDSAWTDGAAALGWRGPARPSGPPAPAPPLVEPAAGLALTVSARLDDRDALCDKLDVSDPQRADLSDAALVLLAYRRWGRECPQHLLGDYAFAVWDARRRTLFCARDHAGVRPFYYCLEAERIVFASDVNAVLAAPGVPDELDERAVATWLITGERSFGAHTFLRAVRSLRPGRTLAVEDGAARVERWWKPEDTPDAPGADDGAAAEAFLDVYARAVGDRLRGADPVGVHVSGGLDSSSVAVLAARALRRAGRPAPLAFSWLPRRDAAANPTEHDLVEAVCRQEGLPVFHRAPSAADSLAWLRRDAVRDPDELLNEVSVRRCAADRGVRVLLSGWGGDEGISFNGRGYYPQLLRDGRLGKLWRELRAGGRRPLARLLLSAVLPLLLPGAHLYVARLLRLGEWPWRNRTFVHPAFARRMPPLPGPGPEPTGVRRMQVHLLTSGDLEARMEGWAASGARHGIEYRYPLLDRRVLEFALGLPPEQFRRGVWSRWLMRHALGPVLPPEVRWNRSKQDPVRSEAARTAFIATLPEVRAILRTGPPGRSPYVDMPRLTAHLDGDRLRAGRMGKFMRSALRLLDI